VVWSGRVGSGWPVQDQTTVPRRWSGRVGSGWPVQDQTTVPRMQTLVKSLMHCCSSDGHMLIESVRLITDCRRSQLGCAMLVTDSMLLNRAGCGEVTYRGN